MHCAMCSCCRRFGIQLRFISRLCQSMPEHCESLEKEFPLPDDARERLRRKIAEETGMEESGE